MFHVFAAGTLRGAQGKRSVPGLDDGWIDDRGQSFDQPRIKKAAPERFFCNTKIPSPKSQSPIPSLYPIAAVAADNSLNSVVVLA